MFGSDEVPFYEAGQQKKSRNLVALGIALVALCLVAAVVVCGSGLLKPAAVQVESKQLQQATNQGEESAQQVETIYVHVLGCVEAPGVYQLPKGSRAVQAVELAGGLSPDAADDSVNLAQELCDGQQLRILSVQEQELSAVGPSSAGTDSESAGNGKVNINAASIEQLQTLSGVGQSTAQKIVAYRQQHGFFSSIEELMNVSGIGEKKFEALKDFITV